ncbi:LptF/LptG family permease [Fretibacter rubidus]|uniref:LptF/LptG family permease n=1 Tax=Fretibacter rubidus TaxID=570162 RepID=UPI00352A4089
MFKFLTYLSKSFFITWLTVVFGFLVLIGLLDSLANGGDILADDGTFVDTFRYMAYRAPVIFDRIFIFTIHVAILLTFVKLIRNHELVALLGFGISAPKQIALLAPAVLTAGLVSIIAINVLMPPSVRALQAWGIGEYKIKNVTEDNPLWMEDAGRIMRAADRDSMNTLGTLELYERSPDTGAITNVTWAERADFTGDSWRLSGVRTLDVKGADGEARQAETVDGNISWETKQTPQSIARLAAEPRDLALSDMAVFSEKGNSGSKPSFAYGFWYLHRITRPLAALLLLLLAVPIMQRVGRQDTGDQALIIGITAGFLFLIIDGAMATFAASGGIAIGWAIAFPLLVVGLIGSFLLLRTESLT